MDGRTHVSPVLRPLRTEPDLIHETLVAGMERSFPFHEEGVRERLLADGADV